MTVDSAANGILAYGAYIPHYRLDRSLITATLGSGGGRGSRSVASYDEDVTSMGVEAARTALRGTDLEPTVVTLATSDPPYLDRTNATAIHAALNMDRSVLATDAVGGPRSGPAQLILGCRSPLTSVVIASDIRTGRPGSADEANGGDGAAAFVCGPSSAGDLLAEYVGSASVSQEFLDRWRSPGNRYSRVWEERFAEGIYSELAHSALTAALDNAGLEAHQLNHVIVSGLHSRARRTVGRRLAAAGLGEALASGPDIGTLGAADAGVSLAAVLDVAGPGETVAVLSLADGADCLILRTTEALAGGRPATSVAGQIAAGDDSLDYAKFLTWRGMLEREPPRRPDPDRPAGPPSYRSEHWKFGFIGSRDRSTGAIHLPPQRVSMEGGAVDDMEPVPMADVGATIATFTVDRLAYSLSPPVVAAVIDFDGGGRFQCEMTDVDPEKVAIGDRVEMTFRRLFTADGVHNYFWKARPARH